MIGHLECCVAQSGLSQIRYFYAQFSITVVIHSKTLQSEINGNESSVFCHQNTVFKKIITCSGLFRSISAYGIWGYFSGILLAKALCKGWKWRKAALAE